MFSKYSYSIYVTHLVMTYKFFMHCLKFTIQSENVPLESSLLKKNKAINFLESFLKTPLSFSPSRCVQFYHKRKSTAWHYCHPAQLKKTSTVQWEITFFKNFYLNIFNKELYLKSCSILMPFC